MMGKRAAQSLAREERLTWGDLLSLVERPCLRSGTCPINSELTMGYSQDLFVEVGKAHDLEEVPKAWCQDAYKPGRVKPTSDFLTVTNILRIFGPPTEDFRLGTTGE